MPTNSFYDDKAFIMHYFFKDIIDQLGRTPYSDVILNKFCFRTKSVMNNHWKYKQNGSLIKNSFLPFSLNINKWIKLHFKAEECIDCFSASHEAQCRGALV